MQGVDDGRAQEGISITKGRGPEDISPEDVGPEDFGATKNVGTEGDEEDNATPLVATRHPRE
jgi:hypothetical protein